MWYHSCLWLGQFLIERVSEYSRVAGIAIGKIFVSGDSSDLRALPIELAEMFNRTLSDDFLEFQMSAKLRRALEESAAKLAHDIRSPLMVLNIALGEPSGLKDDRKPLAFGALKRINDIAEALLSEQRSGPAKVGGRQSSPATLVGATDLGNLVENVLMEKRVEHSKRRMHLTFSPSGRTVAAFVPEVELRRALSNLVNNAVEASAEGGQIEVSVREIDQCSVAISVKDSGRGIPSDLIPKLAERGATYGKKHGTGLGLFQVKQTMAKAGGEMQIQSEPGCGTEVTLLMRKSSSEYLSIS